MCMCVMYERERERELTVSLPRLRYVAEYNNVQGDFLKYFRKFHKKIKLAELTERVSSRCRACKGVMTELKGLKKR